MKKFIITGGNFQNKGAQAMSFVAISEIRQRYPDCEICFISTTDKKSNISSMMTFNIYSASISDWQYARGGLDGFLAIGKSFIKYFSGNKEVFQDMRLLKAALNGADAIIDISGFSLSSQWGCDATYKYTNIIHTAKSLGIKVFIMPQSFGPFEYNEKQRKMDKLIKKYMPYPTNIYAREESGFKYLTEMYGLKNVRRSRDLVLQNKEIVKEKIFNNKFKIEKINLDTSNNVAIIPNMRNFDHGNKEEILSVYYEIIQQLFKMNKNIYLLRHSSEDINACKMIKSLFENDDRVILIENDLNCFEYDYIVNQFDYIIASRYHSIVHAYKQYVPAIVLGWADKYHELLRLFKQEQYIFDVRDKMNFENIKNSIAYIEQNYINDKKIIKDILEGVQNNNCFDIIDKYI